MLRWIVIVVIPISAAKFQMHFNKLCGGSSIGPRNRTRGAVHERHRTTMSTVPISNVVGTADEYVM